MDVAGIDVGAGTAKAVIMRDGQVLAYSIMPVGGSVSGVAEAVMRDSLEKANVSMDDLNYVISTGYGRNAISFSDETMTEIICHARGVHSLIPEVSTIIDIGAQDSKVIRVNERGNVTNFAMNDKCAAGSGRFLEVIAQALGIRLEEMGTLSLSSNNPCQISSICTVFAESEVVSLRAEGKPIEDLIAGIHKAIATRVFIMGSGLRFEESIVFTGGVAKNQGAKRAFEEVTGREISLPREPQITGALGAALFAEAECRKNGRIG